MRRDYGLKQRVSMIITIELSEDDIIDLRALEGLCWYGMSSKGAICREYCIADFGVLRNVLLAQ